MSSGPFRENGVHELISTALNEAGLDLYEMKDIASNPRLSSVREGAAIIEAKGIDVILAVGGGSAIDCAKVIGASGLSGVDPYEYLWGDRPDITASIPVVTVPTLAATGTEVNPYAVIVNDDTKEKFYCETPHPVMAIMDPELTVSVPLVLTIWGSMDILSHTFEFYFNGDTASEMQLCFSEAIIMSTMSTINQLVANPKDVKARGELMWQAVMAWGGLTKIGRSDPDMVCHGIEESFSGWFDTHHGACLGVLTPRWMDRVQLKKADGFARFGRKVFGLSGDDDILVSLQAIASYKEWLKTIEAPMTFHDIGKRSFDEKDLQHVATTACRIYGGKLGRLVEFNESEVMELLKAGNVAY